MNVEYTSWDQAKASLLGVPVEHVKRAGDALAEAFDRKFGAVDTDVAPPGAPTGDGHERRNR